MRKFTKLALIIFLYFLVSLIVTYPLINNNLGQRILGGEDANYALWWDWWYGQAVTVEHQNPFSWNNYLFYPDGFRLGSSHEGSLYHVVGSLGQLIYKNQLLVYNLHCLFALSFSAWAVFLLLDFMTKQTALSWLGGLVVGFSPYQLAHLTKGHTNLFSFGFVPLFTLSFFRLLQRPSKTNLTLVATFFFLVGLSSWVYLYFVFVCLGLFLFLKYLSTFRGKFSSFLRWLYQARVVHLLAISFLIFLPFIWPMVRGAVSRETVVYRGDFGAYGSADLTSYFLPPPSSNLGKFLSTDRIYDHYFIYNEAEATTFLGWLELATLIFVFLRLFSYLRGKIWLYLLGGSFILSLGPLLRIAGEVFLPLPYIFLAMFPFASMSRVPARFSIFVIFFLAIFLVVNLSEWFSKLSLRSRMLLFGVSLLIVLGERLFLPFPLFKEPISAFYSKLREDKESYAVVNFPLSEVNWNALANFAQTIHRKKVVGGYISVHSVTPKVTKFLDSNFALSHSRCAGFDWQIAKDTRENQPVRELFRVLAANDVRHLILHKYLLEREECSLYREFLDGYLGSEPIYYEDNLLKVYQTH